MNDKVRGAGYILVSKGLATQLGAILIRNLIHSKKKSKKHYPFELSYKTNDLC